jgi:hypothetical protein
MDTIQNQDLDTIDGTFARYRAWMVERIRGLTRQGRLTEVGKVMADLDTETARHESQRAQLLKAGAHASLGSGS